MAIIKHPIAKAVGPVSSTPRVTNSRPGRRCAWGRRRRTVLVCYIACECKHAIIECVIRGRMIKDRLLRCRARIRRIKKRRNCLRDSLLCGGAARGQKEAAENDRSEERRVGKEGRSR